MDIKHRSFDHRGNYYFYRVHNDKVNNLCNNGFESLKAYLNYVFESCPNEYFTSGPRSSALRFKLGLDKIQIQGHEINKLTKLGLNENSERYKTSHSKVQVFMLENDNTTIATEVPIWIKPYELNNFKKLFKSNYPLTGHIDILKVEDDKVWVWDYKPDAKHEKYADTQVYFYALMLSKRTGIDLENFRCGYFDEDDTFIFKPKKDFVTKYKNLFNF